MTSEGMSLRERLAELEHEQWQHLAKFWDIKHPLRDVPYSQLTEQQKDSDRKWADKVLRLVAEEVKGMKNPYPYEPREAIRGGVYTAFEECRANIAALLRKGGKEGSRQ